MCVRARTHTVMLTIYNYNYKCLLETQFLLALQPITH